MDPTSTSNPWSYQIEVDCISATVTDVVATVSRCSVLAWFECAPDQFLGSGAGMQLAEYFSDIYTPRLVWRINDRLTFDVNDWRGMDPLIPVFRPR